MTIARNAARCPRTIPRGYDFELSLGSMSMLEANEVQLLGSDSAPLQRSHLQTNHTQVRHCHRFLTMPIARTRLPIREGPTSTSRFNSTLDCRHAGGAGVVVGELACGRSGWSEPRAGRQALAEREGGAPYGASLVGTWYWLDPTQGSSSSSSSSSSSHLEKDNCVRLTFPVLQSKVLCEWILHRQG